MRIPDLPGDLDPLSRRRGLELLGLSAIVAAAAALRLWALDSQPGGLYPDEAAEAYDAHRLLHDPGFHPVFFQADAGREALYGYMVAVAFRVGGESTSVLRGTSAVLGVLAVVAVYLWLRRRGPTVALSGAAWAAGSLWLVCISRNGMRNVLVPLAGALALWAMSAWAAKPSRNRALLAGVSMAAGLWTYQPLKLLPLLFLLWAVWLRREDLQRWQAMRPLLGWVALAYVVAGAPMLYTAATDPGHYFGRAVAVTAGRQAASGPGLDHTIRTLLMFPLFGDPNPRHNVDALPLLGLPLTALAGAGASAAWRRREEPLECLLLVSVPVFLIPPLVATADAAPHFLRSLGLAAPLAGLVGMGAAEMLRLARGIIPAPTVVAGLALILAGLAGGSGAAYFSRPVGARYDAYSFNLVQLAGAAGSAGRATVLLDGYRASDVRFLDWKAIGLGRLVITDPSPPAAHSQPPCRGTVFALTHEDVGQVYGAAIASGARVVGRDPSGNPSVWSSPC